MVWCVFLSLLQHFEGPAAVQQPAQGLPQKTGEDLNKFVDVHGGGSGGGRGGSKRTKEGRWGVGGGGGVVCVSFAVAPPCTSGRCPAARGSRRKLGKI